ncbi:hypothetical protein [Antrihabitans sp. YC2-6]|uniref:maltokinase N-terminal cap-like domain-containing protein n=1 Tax=Antrihabitans sp. YC2-6 TaxID=2799498 RepID=UPI0018F4AE82|nr:hypothetical protein [Antrihabitans sp. YC2-6]MBJ8346552.1 hypothetical protein [Antrihabitans sp. YC2-6]
MIAGLPSDADLESLLVGWLPAQRWFSAKNRTISGARILLRQNMIDDDGFVAEHTIVDVQLVDAPAQRYQIPLAFRIHPPEAFMPHALTDAAGAVTPYDGLADPEVTARYIHALAHSESVGDLRFRTAPGGTVDPALRGRILGAEQSNTSVVYGEQLLLKLFRRVEAGLNPDLELHRALGEVGCEFVAPLVGWMETEVDSIPTTMAIAQQFIPNAAEGWSMALTSVRDLFTEADLHADELGTDFAGEAQRLGEAVAAVHADLARSLGTEVRPVPTAMMRLRLDVAAEQIPEVAAARDAATKIFDRAESAGPTQVQRIHSDLHLGQTLRTPPRWVLIDFEGEPVKTIAERREFDSPLRDVAGMLRSFDYAGHHPLIESTESNSAQRAFRANEWTARNSSAFCDGYAAVAQRDPRDDSAILRAYELDKAIYEAVYESRHRPSWLPLPVQAIARLVSL